MDERIVFIAPRPRADGKAGFEYVVTYESGRCEFVTCASDKILTDLATLAGIACQEFGGRRDG